MPNLVCLDASFVVRMLESDTPDAPALRWWRRGHTQGWVFVAPILLPFEVTNALYRYVRHDLATLEIAQALIAQMLNLGIRLYADPGLHQEALTLAHDLNLSVAYDAHYLVLARRLGGELWTADHRLAHAAGPLRSQVRVLEV